MVEFDSKTPRNICLACCKGEMTQKMRIKKHKTEEKLKQKLNTQGKISRCGSIFPRLRYHAQRVRASSVLYWRVLVKLALSGPSGPSVLAPAQRGRFRTIASIPSRHLDDLDPKSVHQALIRGPQTPLVFSPNTKSWERFEFSCHLEKAGKFKFKISFQVFASGWPWN